MKLIAPFDKGKKEEEIVNSDDGWKELYTFRIGSNNTENLPLVKEKLAEFAKKDYEIEIVTDSKRSTDRAQIKAIYARANPTRQKYNLDHGMDKYNI